MVFSRNGRVPEDKFRYYLGGDETEYVNPYKYLEVNFSNTRKFSVAENIKSKANRALFSVKQSVFDIGLKPSAVLRYLKVLAIALWEWDFDCV